MRPGESIPSNASQGIILALMVDPEIPNLSRSHEFSFERIAPSSHSESPFISSFSFVSWLSTIRRVCISGVSLAAPT